MNAGVSTTPCAKRRRPRRARAVASDDVEAESSGHGALAYNDSPSAASGGAAAVDTRETTSRRRALRRPVRRARSVAGVGGRGVRQSRPQALRAGRDPHREGRPLGAGRSSAVGRRRPPKSSIRCAATRARVRGGREVLLPPRPGDDTLVLVDRRADRRTTPRAAAALTGLGARRHLPGAARPVRRGRHDSGPARAGQRRRTSAAACWPRPSAWTRR